MIQYQCNHSDQYGQCKIVIPPSLSTGWWWTSFFAIHIAFANLQNSIAALSACFSLKQLDLTANNLRDSAHVIDVLYHLSGLKQLDIGDDAEIETFLRKSSGIKLFNGKVIAHEDVSKTDIYIEVLL